MARIRENTSPKISSHSAGCTVRVSTSVGSWRSLRTSHDAIISVFLKKFMISAIGETWRGCANVSVLPKSPRCAAGSCSFMVISSRFQGIACIMDKHIVERCMLASYCGLEIVRSIQRNDVSSMHDTYTMTEAIGLLHRMGG